jgi:hypothetical protein
VSEADKDAILKSRITEPLPPEAVEGKGAKGAKE